MSKKNENNTKTLLKNFIEQSAPKVTELNYSTEHGDLTVKVYPVLPFSKRAAMIREIVNGVFMGDKSTIDDYVPEFLEFIKRYTTIEYFTDLGLPKKLDDAWLVLNYTSVYEDVAKILGKDLLSIFDEASKSIDAYKEYLTKKSDANTFIKKITDSMKDFDGKLPDFDISKLSEIMQKLPKDSPLNNIISSLLNASDLSDNKK